MAIQVQIVILKCVSSYYSKLQYREYYEWRVIGKGGKMREFYKTLALEIFFETILMLT